MLSFITEQFNIDLVEGVFRQRLLICIIKEFLLNKFHESKIIFEKLDNITIINFIKNNKNIRP